MRLRRWRQTRIDYPALFEPTLLCVYVSRIGSRFICRKRLSASQRIPWAGSGRWMPFPRWKRPWRQDPRERRRSGAARPAARRRRDCGWIISAVPGSRPRHSRSGSGRRNDRRRWRMTLPRNRKFAASPLEGNGFELTVPREYRPSSSCANAAPGRSSAQRRRRRAEPLPVPRNRSRRIRPHDRFQLRDRYEKSALGPIGAVSCTLEHGCHMLRDTPNDRTVQRPCGE
jgi:hypothetical protein